MKKKLLSLAFLFGSLFSNAQSGAALNFDGSNDRVDLGNGISTSLTGSTKVTVEAWVKPTSLSGLGVIVGNYQTGSGANLQILLRRSGNSFYEFWVGNGSSWYNTNSVATPTLNVWQHVAASWNGTVASIYVNGVLSGTTTPALSTLGNAGSGPVWIGGNSVNESFTGDVDDVRIWNVARTQCDIISYKNCEIPTTAAGLLANYHFNQGFAASNNPTENNLTDASGNSNTGTLTNFALIGATSNWVTPGGVISGSITPSTCTPAAALSFDGADDYVDLGSPTNLPVNNSAYTIEAKIKPNVLGVNGIIGWGNYGSSNAVNALRLDASGNIVNYWWGADLAVSASPINLLDGNWHHIAATFDGTTRSIYVDGILKGSDNPGSAHTVPAMNVRIGSTCTICGGEFFDGGIDEVRIWNTGRSQCEIISFKDCEIPSTASGLVANYHFNQGIDAFGNPTEASLTDASGNSNTGTLTNFALSGATSNWVAPGGVVSGSIIPSTCTPAAALNFDGVDDYVMTSSNISHGNQFTYEAWVNPMSANQWGGIMTTSSLASQSQWVQITLNPAGALRAEIVDDAGNNKWYEGNTSLLGAWHHIAVSFDGTNLLFYVDGNVESTSAINNATLSTMTINSQLNIGAERNHSVFYNGDIDEVRVWNVARTKCEINTYKNCEITSSATGLVANYHFNQGVDAFDNSIVTSLTDASGNSNTGTLNNFALTGSTSNWIAPGAVVSGYTTTLTPPTIAVNNGAICLGQSFTMTPSGAVTYTFSNGSAIATPTADATYSVSGTDANGCMSSMDAISSVTVNICTTAAALDFDGADDYVQLLDPNFGTADFTLETWMNPNAATGAHLISTRTSEFSAGGNWFTLSYGSAGKIGLELADAGIGYYYFETPGTPIVLNAWNHVAIVRSGLNFSIYVNGVLSASYTDTGIRNFITGTNSIRLSGWADVGVAFFNGKMDETRFWNVARTQCEINTYKDCEIPSTTAGLIANYHFNQGFDAANNATEINLMDASGNSNIGTLTNFALNSATSNWIAPGAVVSGYTTTLAPPTIAVNNGAICLGQSFTMTPSGATTYTFSNGSAIATPTADATYSVSGTGVNGCVSQVDAVSTVTVNMLPTISVNSGAICMGQSFTIVASGAVTYAYSSGTNVVMPTSDATYSVSGTGVNGCVSQVDAVSSVTVNVLPFLITSTTNTLLCTGETATLSVSGATSYTWSTSQTTSSIAVTPTVQTTYTVDGMDANGCTNTTTIMQDVSLCTGIASIIATETMMNVYPNPNKGLFIIELNGTSQVSISSTLGQVIMSDKLDAGKHNLDIQNQSTGIYFVKVIQDGKQQVIKLIKE